MKHHVTWIGCSSLGPLTFLDFSDFGEILSCDLNRGFLPSDHIMLIQFERTHIRNQHKIKRC